MTTLDVLDASGTPSGSVELPDAIFDAPVNVPLIHQVVVAQQAAARQGTASTKTRGEVSGGGRKPYRQKGTGRARQGSIRAPQFAGGGVVHGPTPRSYDQRTPKKMKAAALRGALSDRARAGRVHIVESLLAGDTPSTRSAVTVLGRLTPRPRVLLVLERADTATWLSLRNVDTVHLLAVDQLNTYDVLLSDDVVFTRGALDALVTRARVSAQRAADAEPASGATEVTEVTEVTEKGSGDGVIGKVTEVTGAVASAVISTVASAVTGAVTGNGDSQDGDSQDGDSQDGEDA